MIKYFERNFVTIYIDQERQLVYLEWKGELKDNAYVEGVEASLKACAEYNLRKLVYNDLQLGSIDMMARIKVMTEIAPNAWSRFGRAKGYLAIVRAPNATLSIISQFITKGIRRFVPTFEVEYFDTTDQAFEWIVKVDQ